MNSLRIGNLTIKKPIVQGGMGVAISLSGLAAAVANQGGIGVISAAAIGMSRSDYTKNFRKANKLALAEHIDIARQNSEGVIGVNLMVALSDYDELLELSIEKEVDIVFMGAGLPLKLPQSVIDKGFKNIHTKFAPKVSGAKAAELIFKYWSSKFNHIPDAIVVEGPKAGGHLGFKKQELISGEVKLSNLVQETVQTIKKYEIEYGKKVPIIAAGGIYTGKDIYEIMQAGASAVKLGTRFVTTHECDADIKFKESYLESSKNDIEIIQSPVGLPGRVIRNDFVDKINNGETKPVNCPWKCIKSCNYKEVPYCISKVLHNSAIGNMDEGFAFAGSNAYKATKIQSVKDVFAELTNEYQEEMFSNTLSKKDLRRVSIAV